MNGYVCFYKGKRIEVHAETSFQATRIAAEQFKAKKTYEVTAVLAEKNSQQVVHTAMF